MVHHVVHEPTSTTSTMVYEVSKIAGTEDDWAVERILDEEELLVELAVFSGADAERRAQEYAAWKNEGTTRNEGARGVGTGA